MLLMSLVLISFTSEAGNILYGGCISISVLVHYFALVAVMWMGAEALLMFRKVVIVFVRITTKYIVTVSLVCWCKPFNLCSMIAWFTESHIMIIILSPYSGSCGPCVNFSSH